MISAKSILRFLGVFAVIFTVLMLPWLGLAEGYMAVFRTVGTWCFSRDEDRREVAFLESPDKSARPTYARIEIANRERLKPDGSGLVRNVDFDVRGLGWKPTALLIALVLASPLPWKRRLAALCWGLFWVQAVMMGLLAYIIWNQSSEVGLITMSPFWKTIASAWQHHFIAQFSLAAPVAVWLLVTFRTGDLGIWQRADRNET
ncbi:MAG: hypothetical protein WC003_16685 [Terrimicrobiaceae bacterium]